MLAHVYYPELGLIDDLTESGLHITIHPKRT